MTKAEAIKILTNITEQVTMTYKNHLTVKEALATLTPKQDKDA